MTEQNMLRIGIVGAGQIARVQHIPAIAATPGLVLASVVNPVPVDLPASTPATHSRHQTLAGLLASGEAIDAVAICTPPQIRFDLAVAAIDAGKHVLLEKPPAATPAEIAWLADHATARGVTLFTAWHSLFSDGVAQARAILAARGASGMRIVWKEDVQKYHPGVDWFWQPGGMGAFDAGINALSILVGVMPEPIFIRAAHFSVAAGAHTPVAATLEFATSRHREGFTAELDWNEQEGETWTIAWTLDDGSALTLERGGAILKLDGQTLVSGTDQEYPRLYAHFRDLIHAGTSDVEFRPLQLVADAFMLARRV